MKQLALLILLAGSLMAQAGKTNLKVGDTAPAFKDLSASDGKKYSLADYIGKKNVVLSFFPLAFTGGCTAEMKGYQAGIKKFGEVESQVFGISVDSAPTLKRFSEDLTLEFPLLSDLLRNTSKSYGVYMEDRGIASRTTFVIDKQGKIADIIFDPKPAPHNDGAIEACSRLQKKS